MRSDLVTVQLNLALADASPDELDGLRRALHAQLAEQPVERIDLVQQERLPPHAKAVDPITLGALALAVLPAMLPKIVEFLDHFTGRKQSLGMKLKLSRGDRTIELDIPAGGYGPERLKEFLSVANSVVEEESGGGASGTRN